MQVGDKVQVVKPKGEYQQYNGRIGTIVKALIGGMFLIDIGPDEMQIVLTAQNLKLLQSPTAIMPLIN